MDKQEFKSYSQVVAVALVEFFDRHYRLQDDPYLETREREEQFVTEIVSSVQSAMKETLPLFLSGFLAGATGQPLPNALPIGNEDVQEPLESTTSEIDEANIDWDFLSE